MQDQSSVVRASIEIRNATMFCQASLQKFNEACGNANWKAAEDYYLCVLASTEQYLDLTMSLHRARVDGR